MGMRGRETGRRDGGGGGPIGQREQGGSGPHLPGLPPPAPEVPEAGRLGALSPCPAPREEKIDHVAWRSRHPDQPGSPPPAATSPWGMEEGYSLTLGDRPPPQHGPPMARRALWPPLVTAAEQCGPGAWLTLASHPQLPGSLHS